MIFAMTASKKPHIVWLKKVVKIREKGSGETNMIDNYKNSSAYSLIRLHSSRLDSIR